MWKKLFVVLLSINMVAFVSMALWFGSLPKAGQSIHPVTIPATAANVQLTIGQQAVNAYLGYALDEQKDMKKVLSYARVTFSDTWNIEMGLKVADRIVPCEITLIPTVHQGNLWLPLQSATIGGLPVPKSLLFYLFQHVPWPSWIVVDAEQQLIQVNLTERPPASPYRIRALQYSVPNQEMTFLISIMPKQLSAAK